MSSRAEADDAFVGVGAQVQFVVEEGDFDVVAVDLAQIALRPRDVAIIKPRGNIANLMQAVAVANFGTGDRGDPFEQDRRGHRTADVNMFDRGEILARLRHLDHLLEREGRGL